MTKNIQYYMRVLHRDIGFFVISLTVIYCLSGLLLTYENTNFLKSERQIEQQLAPNMPLMMVARLIGDKGFRIQNMEDGTVAFQGLVSRGTYNRMTGELRYTAMKYPRILEMFNALHKTRHENKVHIFTVAYSILLLFLAVSSFFMYKPGSRVLKRGIIISILGVIASVLMMLPFL